jgi:hypothetical protein
VNRESIVAFLFLQSKRMTESDTESVASTESTDSAFDGIRPDHFYDGVGGVPVFKPTWDEFRDFNAFVSRIDRYGAKYGIGTRAFSPLIWRS